MSIEKATGPKKPAKAKRRGPRPKNPYGISNEEWDRISLESSRRYPGKWIAWSPGHDTVVAVGDTFEDAQSEAERLGHDVRALIYESPPRIIFREMP